MSKQEAILKRLLGDETHDHSDHLKSTKWDLFFKGMDHEQLEAELERVVASKSANKHKLASVEFLLAKIRKEDPKRAKGDFVADIYLEKYKDFNEEQLEVESDRLVASRDAPRGMLALQLRLAAVNQLLLESFSVPVPLGHDASKVNEHYLDIYGEYTKDELEAERDLLVANYSPIKYRLATVEFVLKQKRQENPTRAKGDFVANSFILEYKDLNEEQLEAERERLLVSRSPLIYRKASIEQALYSKHRTPLPKNHDKTNVYQKFVDEYLKLTVLNLQAESARVNRIIRDGRGRGADDSTELRKNAVAFAAQRMKNFQDGFKTWLAQLTEAEETAFWHDMGEAASIHGIKDYITGRIHKLIQKAPPEDYVCEVRCDDGKEPTTDLLPRQLRKDAYKKVIEGLKPTPDDVVFGRHLNGELSHFCGRCFKWCRDAQQDFALEERHEQCEQA